MKLLTKILLILFISMISTSGNAQFLKKLQQRVQEAAEETVIRKAEDKAAEKTGEGVDKVLNMDVKKIFNKNIGGMSTVDPSMLPENYDFEWKYSMQMQTKDGSFTMEYYLKPDAKYFGAKPNMQQKKSEGSMFMVMDMERNINTIFMDMEGSKMATPTSIPNEMTTDEDEENFVEDYTFEEIGTKIILGYQCQGFQMENDEVEMIMYVTTGAPVSFTQIYGADTKKAPKGFNPKWLDKTENSLVMEMEYTDKKKNKNNAKMICIALNEEFFSIQKSDYQFMNMAIEKE